MYQGRKVMGISMETEARELGSEAWDNCDGAF